MSNTLDAMQARLAGMMFNLSSVGMAHTDALSRRFLCVNPALCALTGYGEAELLDMTVDELNHPEDRGADGLVFERFMRGEASYQVEKRYRRKGGGVVWVRVTADVVRDAQGCPLRCCAVIEDISERKRGEQRLRESESRLHAIANLVPGLLWSTDPAGHADWFNRRWCEYTGQSEAQAMGDGWADVVHPDDRAEAVARWHEALRRHQPLDNELRLRGHDGHYRWHLVRAEPQLGDDGRVLRWFGSATDAHAVHGVRDLLEQRVQDRTRELRTLLARVEHVQDEERRRIARELHDSLGQYLSSLALAVGTVTQQQRDAEDREWLRRLQPLMQQVDRELDRIVFTLRPTALEDCGLGDGVAAYVATWSALSSTPVDLEQHGLDGERLPAPVEAAVFRVIQEALNNVAKHAGATRVSVSLKRSRRHLQASVEDDGVGFEAAEGRDGGAGRAGWGVLGMKERIEALGGQFAVESQPGTGTTVLLRVPLQEDSAAQ
ncbi:PAS domain-containing sensor histidine kinase [Azohydromonas lata]|uniref:PAS domain-containing sensor histidine kinase n=1 Tax=Azohydromonas lata TaxID=45677 RepID=UPI000A064C16|nr:sensor histidine kinase [Azohydromonas lata]